MKFYIISIVLNVLFVTLAVGYVASQEEANPDIMNVSLENMSFSGNNSGKAGESIQTKSSDVSENIKKTEKTVVSEVSKEVPKNENLEKSNETVKTMSSENTNSSEKVSETGGKTAGNSDGNSGGPAGEKLGGGGTNGPKDGSGNTKGTAEVKKVDSKYACTEGKGYKVSYKPNLETPKAAERSGSRGTVMVSISFNSNGSVSVLGASGGDAVLQAAAKKAAQGMKITILDSQVTKCKVSKPFTFN